PPVVFSRAPKEKEEKGETRDDVTGQVEERVTQKMAEGHDDQNATERDERLAHAKPYEQQRAGQQFDDWNRYPNQPERPNRQEGIGKWQEIFAGMLERAELKNLPNAGHQKDQARTNRA